MGLCIIEKGERGQGRRERERRRQTYRERKTYREERAIR
jgi:hypothetical protein